MGSIRAPRGRSPILLLAALSLVMLRALPSQAYGLDARPATTAYLNMPTELPVPTGDFVTELAFPSLTFDNPVFLTSLPGTSQLIVCEREGRVWSFLNDPGSASKTLVLDLSAVTQGWDDCGLLGLAFHPEFGVQASPNRGFVYVLHQYNPSPVPGPDRPPIGTETFNRLVRYTIPDGGFVADPASELVLIQQHDRSTYHNGGAMFFHPVDGFLYFTIGDEGRPQNADSTQRIDEKLFSGVFRIDVDMRGAGISHPIRRQPQSYPGRPSFTQNYFVPDDNPWLDAGGAVLEEFFALGFRSPHRMTYDAVSDTILLGDVGHDLREEVNVIEAGRNYQWPFREGTAATLTPPPANVIGVETPPLYEYLHTDPTELGGDCVVGGYVYRGSAFPELNGRYVFGDNIRGSVWAMDLSSDPVQVEHLCSLPPGGYFNGLASFGVDADGEHYMCKMDQSTTGRIYRLGRSTVTGAPVPPLLSQTGAFSDVVNLVPSPSLVPYEVGSPLYSDNAIKTRWIALPDGQQIVFGETGEWTFPPGTVFVKHFELVVDEVTQARRRLETRLIVQKADGVYGVTYRWRSDNSDADLLVEGLEEHITIVTGTGTRQQTWSFPSSQACLSCHTAIAGHVLGVKTRQLNNDLTYPGSGVTDNQLRTWSHIGMFHVALDELLIPTYDALAPLDDTSASLEHRVRSYLDANCAHCHRPSQVQAYFDAHFDTPLAQQGLIDGVVGNDLGVGGAAVLRAKDPHRSILRLRDMSIDPAIKMPPLAKNTVDVQWVDVLEQYIDSLPGVPALDPPTISPPAGAYDTTVDVTIAHGEPSALLYYTTDGSDPDTNAQLYGGPITLTDPTTLRVRAFAAGFVESVVAAADFTVVPFRAPDAPASVAPGLYYKHYLGAFSTLPDFAALSPDEVGTRLDFSLSPSLAADGFAFVFFGFVEIATPGVYTFYTRSDDGSRLSIGETVVVDNDGVHQPTQRQGDVALQAGLHAITVEYFDRFDGELLEVDFESATMARTAVPASALFRELVDDDVAVVTLPPVTVSYDGDPVVVTGATDPPGLALDVLYDGSPTPPTDAGVYAVLATVNDPVYTGSATTTLTIEPALAGITISGVARLFDGAPKAVNVTTTPAGLAFTTTYDGSATPPSDAGTYAVQVVVDETNHAGTATAMLVIDPASASVALAGLTQDYDGTPRVVTATSTPPGLPIDVTYDGAATPPTNAGSYAVVAAVTDGNYVGAASNTLVVQPIAATVVLSDLTQPFTGAPIVVTTTTTPPGLPVDLLFNGSSTPPSAVGAYAVVASIADGNHVGQTVGTLVIQSVSATVTLGDLTQPYDGTPRAVDVTTAPPGLPVQVLYNSSPNPPTDVGVYAVSATVTDPNYTGQTVAVLTVEQATASIVVNDLTQPYDGTPRAVSVTTVPAGLPVNVTYNGSATPPSAVGVYAVVASVADRNYGGQVFETLMIEPGVATITFDQLTQVYDGAPKAVAVSTNPVGLPVTITYDGAAAPPVDVGSYAVAVTVVSANYTGVDAATLTIEPAPAAITLSELLQDFTGAPRDVTATTVPAGLPVLLLYDGVAQAPTAVGSYAVTASIANGNYSGAAAGTLTVRSTITAQPGDVGVVGGSDGTFAVRSAGGGVTTFDVGSFGGTAGAARAVLHDERVPTDFLIGGPGFLGRATVTAGGPASYAVISTQVDVGGMSWDGPGGVLVADEASDQVVHVALGGTVTALTSGAQPWSDGLVAAVRHLPSGGIYAIGTDGGAGAVYHVAPAATTATVHAALPAAPTGLIVDPCSGDLLVVMPAVDRVVRVDALGVVTDVVPAGTVPAPRSLGVDGGGALLVGTQAGDVVRVGSGGATSTLVSAPLAAPVDGVAFAGAVACSFGTACPGATGPTTISAPTTLAAGLPLVSMSGGHMPNTIGFAVYGLGQITPPVNMDLFFLTTGGCSLFASPDTVDVALGDPAGNVIASLPTSAPFAGNTVFVQHVAVEAAGFSTFSFSDALRVTF